jgi:hypothetical protein
MIDPEDCNISEPQLSDFPSDPVFQRKGEIFIYWTRLCAIIGKTAKCLSRTSNTLAAPLYLRQELAEWVASLPPHLQLPIANQRTGPFDIDVHQLHLPYLTTVIVLHLQRSSSHLPRALPPAIVAASCTVRILRDILSRGNTRFLMPITCWYSATAFIPLLQASSIEPFSKEANDGLEILDRTVEQLQKMWGTADIIRNGFRRLRSTTSHDQAPNGFLEQTTAEHINNPQSINYSQPTINESMQSPTDGFNWKQLFPFVTRSTNKIADILLADGAQDDLQAQLEPIFNEDMWAQYQELLHPFMDQTSGFADASFVW